MYTFVIAVVASGLITLILNLFIFKHVRASSRRIQAQANTNSLNIIMNQQPKINRRDISLLKHTICILGLFIIGWAPIYLLIAIDYNGNVIPLVYTILELLAVISLLSCMLDLFLYNHELRRYIIQKFF
jgi:polyferredoxin